MVAFNLEDGKGTTIRVADPSGFVDIDVDSLVAEGSPVSTDIVITQRGAGDPKKTTVQELAAAHDHVQLVNSGKTLEFNSDGDLILPSGGDFIVSSGVVAINTASPFAGYELNVKGQALIGNNTLPSAPNGRGDDLVIVSGDAPHAGITILASTSVGDATIFFGDDSSAIRGRVQYVNEDEALNLGAGGGQRTLGITGSLVEIPGADFTVTAGDVDFPSLPTSDPNVAGRLFRTGNDLQISTG